MEKIYMEENKNKKGKRSVVDTSVVLSFVVAIFAVFSIAMAGISMNQNSGVSYAAVTGDSMTLSFGDKIESSNADRTYFYNFHPYYNGSNHTIENQIFCIERALNVEEAGYTKTSDGRVVGQTISKTNGETSTISNAPDISKDYGLMYLLSIGQSTTQRQAIHSNEVISGWVVQSAIWYYLAEKYPNADTYKLHELDNELNSQSDKKVLDSEVVIINGTQYTGLTAKVKELVAKANSIVTAPRVSVSKVSKDITKTEDGKYYQSSLITVTGDPSDSFNTYSISLSDNDAFIVDENGNTLTGNIPAGTKFYVRIPADKVTQEVKTINIGVSGNFGNASVVYYKTGDDSRQRLATAMPGTVQSGTEVEFVGTPDTGMSTAQTIYFIGLIVLLCGVGIVYANAKPVQAKQ